MVCSIRETFLTVDGYIMNKNQVSLWLSGVVINPAVTPGGVDVRGSLFVDRRRVNVFICMLNFRGWSQL